MAVIINDNKLILIKEPTNIHFYLPKDVGNNLNLELDFMIKYNQFLAEHAVKKGLVGYGSNMSIEKIFMNTKNSKTNGSQKVFLNLLQKLN